MADDQTRQSEIGDDAPGQSPKQGRRRVPTWTTLRAAKHELRCSQCRVTWRSWWQRIVGNPEGMTPHLWRVIVPERIESQIVGDGETALGPVARETLRARAERDRLREAARRVLSADMAGVRDIAALNELEDAAGFRQQGDPQRIGDAIDAENARDAEGWPDA